MVWMKLWMRKFNIFFSESVSFKYIKIRLFLYVYNSQVLSTFNFLLISNQMVVDSIPARDKFLSTKIVDLPSYLAKTVHSQ